MKASPFRTTIIAALLAVVAPLAVGAAASSAEPAPSGNVAAVASDGQGAADFPLAKAFATKEEADRATAANNKSAAVSGAGLLAGQCTASWIYLTGTVGVFTHSKTESPSVIKHYLSSGYHPCRKLVIGGRYNGCGYTDANGWILLPDLLNGPPAAGFVISACTSD